MLNISINELFNKKDEKELQKRNEKHKKAVLQNLKPRENEKIISIGGFIFCAFQNIQQLEYEINLGIQKVECINKNVYLKMGENEKRISFEARILLEYKEQFEQFLSKVCACEPLELSTLDSVNIQEILIDKISYKTKDFFITQGREMDFYTLELSISGVILESKISESKES